MAWKNEGLDIGIPEAKNVMSSWWGWYILELPPHPATVTTRIIPFLARESQPKASFVTVTGRGG